MASINLTDHFLIAMPAMEDPFFAKSLVYIAEHNDQGALGIMVNRLIDMNLATLFKKIDLPLIPKNSSTCPCCSAARYRPTEGLSCIDRSENGNRRLQSITKSD